MRNTSNLITLTVLSSFIAATNIAVAATKPSIETVVVTASRRADDSRLLAASIGVIDAQAIKMTAHSHINEVVNQVAGAWISRGNGQEYLTAIRSPSYTGAGACGEFLMAENGVPLRATGFCNVNQLFEVNSEQAERIEILKGPGYAFHGSNAVHGVINVITMPSTIEDGGSIGLELGPDSFTRGSLALGRVSGAHSLQLKLHSEYDGGYKDSSNYHQSKLNLAHIYDGSDWQVSSMFSATDLDQQTAGYLEGFEAYKDEAIKKDNPNPNAYRKASSVRFSSSFVTVNDSNTQWTITPYLRHSDMEFLQHFLPWQPLEKNGHVSAGVQTASYTQINDSLELKAGLDIEYASGWLEQFQAEPDPFNNPTRPQGFHYDYEVTAYTAAPFIALNAKLSDALSLNVGLRNESTRYDYNNKLSDGSSCDASVPNCRYTRPADSEDSFNDWSPSADLTYSYAATHMAYVKVANGFRAPQTTELYRLQQGQNVANIDSVELNSREIGFKGNWEILQYDVAIFDMDKSNFIFQDSDRNNIDGGKSSHTGIELAATVTFNPIIDLAIAGTIAKHQYDNDINISSVNIKGNDIVTAPRKTANVQLGINTSANSRVVVELVHMGEYYLDAENFEEYSGHNLLNIRAMWQASDQLGFSARLINASDEDYAERARFNFGDYQYFVGQPRGLYMGANYSF
jgi:outer membrane receptor protein involved in Fe transport